MTAQAAKTDAKLNQAPETSSAPSTDVEYPKWLTVKDWPNYFPWPPHGGLRHIVFHSETNGFAPAIKRVGRRVLINTDRFWQIVDE